MFKVGDKVFGVCDEIKYKGTVEEDEGHGMYLIRTDKGFVLLVDLSLDDTMHLDTKLGILLQGDSDV
jgi:hypothetical protein